MEIEYLTSLRDNPTREEIFTNEPLSMSEIQNLEHQYNNGQTFPKALRELLYLAGEYCIIFDYGLNETQQEMQDEARKSLARKNRLIYHPFFVVSVRDGETMLLYVHLDEGDDPLMREASVWASNRPWDRTLSRTLSQYVDLCIELIKQGRSPF